MILYRALWAGVGVGGILLFSDVLIRRETTKGREGFRPRAVGLQAQYVATEVL